MTGPAGGQCTGCFAAPGAAVARDASLAMTSFAFMFEDVPLPVWKTSMGNSRSQRPSATSIAAFWMASAMGASSRPRSRFTRAAAALMSPSVWMNAGGNGRPEIGKFSTARWVCGPHSASAGTCISPRLSFSTRNSAMVLPFWDTIASPALAARSKAL